MDEQTEVKDDTGTTQSAELIPGMAETLRRFRAQGYPLALVADSRRDTPPNVLRQHGVIGLFDHLSISEIVGSEKPNEAIFRDALDAMKIAPADYPA